MNIRQTIAASVIAVCAFGVSAANADVEWLVNGTFDDGGQVNGTFTIDVYGYLLSNFNLQTTTGSTLPGFDYNNSDSWYSNGTFYVDAQPGYKNDLHLQFLNDLNVAAPTDPLVGGPGGPSYECADSWSCYVPSGGTTRYITQGFATAVPEPAAWAMMLVGFFGVGFMMRGSRRKDAIAVA
jgi:hypothetical protein